MEWKYIVGYESLYKIYRDGTIVSLFGAAERILKSRIDSGGYFRIELNKHGKRKVFLLHRLLYTSFIGDIPECMEIDHINRDKLNNDLSNLRLVTRTENEQNKNNKGYYFHKPRQLWRAQISIDKKVKHLGWFKTEIEARSAYVNAKKEYHNVILPE